MERVTSANRQSWHAAESVLYVGTVHDYSAAEDECLLPLFFPFLARGAV